MKIISHIETPFPEKFGVPRQSLLVGAQGVMRFPKNDFYVEAFRGIEKFSHLWLIFEFHQVNEEKLNALVRPPRFENKKKVGVFASRSPHRPNRLGLSVVEFIDLTIADHEVVLTVNGVDLVNGTPILDIKPYLPYADSYPMAKAQDFSEAPKMRLVSWIDGCPLKEAEKKLVEEVIGLDPRPGQEKTSLEEYGVTLLGWNFRFKSNGEGFEILKAVKE